MQFSMANLSLDLAPYPGPFSSPKLNMSLSHVEEPLVQEPRVGHPVSVLRGHTALVSYLDFSRVLPDILLSSSFDGTCRIWDVRHPEGHAMHVLEACIPAGLGRMEPMELRPVERTRAGGHRSGPHQQSSVMQLRHAGLPTTATGASEVVEVRDSDSSWHPTAAWWQTNSRNQVLICTPFHHQRLCAERVDSLYSCPILLLTGSFTILARNLKTTSV
jgi:hypothetical protein